MDRSNLFDTNRANSDVKEHRGELLRLLSEEVDRPVAVFLVDSINGKPSLWASYIQPFSDEIAERLHMRTALLSAVDGQIDDKAILAGVEAIVAESGAPAAFSVALLKPNWSSLEVASREEAPACLGAFAVFGEPVSLERIESDVSHLADAISLSRNQRFVTAVMRSQSLLSGGPQDLGSQVEAAARIIAAELGASRTSIGEIGPNGDWIERSFDEAWSETNVKEDPHEGSDSARPAKELVARSPDARMVIVSLRQRAFALRNIKFCAINDFLKALVEEDALAIEVVFVEKHVSGYSQNRFSKTDARIAETVFKNIETITQLRLSDQSQAETFSTLNEAELDPDRSAEDFYASVRRLAPRLRTLHVITVELLATDIGLSVESMDCSDTLGDDYIHRLKTAYLDRFYHGGQAPDYGALQIGMDARSSKFYVELHTPIEFRNSKIFILEFPEPVIDRSSLTALINLFSELFTRMRKDDYIAARSSSLIETRHAVVHQFAAALNCIDDIKYKWDRGLRNREFWTSMLDDPILPESLDLAFWSLQHAQLILENGRFMVSDIDPRTITRKPMNITQIVNDCLRVLRNETRRKSLIVHHSVMGGKPMVSNGDEVLMRIAIMNLLDNAIKYSLNHGKVRIETVFRQDRYEFRISNSGDFLQEDRFNLLLQVGYRGKQRDRLNVRPGTGLGLPVANRILEAHAETAGLRLKSVVKSDEFGGALNTFYFEMPYLTGQGSSIGVNT